MTAQKERYPLTDIPIADSQWVFISASEQEHRHLLDIIWAIQCLKQKGVKDDQILIFQDNPSFDAHFGPFGLSARVFPIEELEKLVSAVEGRKFCYFIFTGHGSPEGVHSGGKVYSPTFFLKTIRAIKGLERGFLIVGQCFGGIFDSLEVFTSPEVGIIGATKLHNSMSNSWPLSMRKIEMTDNNGNKIPAWGANVFLFHLFSWIKAPVDIDGDGQLTLLDAYKYAGSHTHSDLSELKFIAVLDIREKLKWAQAQLQAHHNGTVALTDMEYSTAVTVARQESMLLYSHQESWLLHAHLVRTSVIK
jgi:hypothetical protein